MTGRRRASGRGRRWGALCSRPMRVGNQGLVGLGWWVGWGDGGRLVEHGHVIMAGRLCVGCTVNCLHASDGSTPTT